VSELESFGSSEGLQAIGFVESTEGVEMTLYRPLTIGEEKEGRRSPFAPGLESSFSPTAPSGQAVLYEGDMPSLEELLNRQRVAYAVLERGPSGVSTVMVAERRVWIALTSVAFVWGILTAASLVAYDFFLHPATALFGCCALVVLAVTVTVHAHRDRHEAL
jgi:hypothetical protein